MLSSLNCYVTGFKDYHFNIPFRVTSHFTVDCFMFECLFFRNQQIHKPQEEKQNRHSKWLRDIILIFNTYMGLCSCENCYIHSIFVQVTNCSLLSEISLLASHITSYFLLIRSGRRVIVHDLSKPSDISDWCYLCYASTVGKTCRVEIPELTNWDVTLRIL